MRVSNPITSLSQIPTRDHDLLAGLADDDHSIYLNNARHDLVARHPASVLGGAVAKIVRKTADEQIAYNVTTLQNDDELYFAVGASDVWLVIAFIKQRGATGAAQPQRYGWTVPAGGSFEWFGSDDVGALADGGSIVEITTGTDDEAISGISVRLVVFMGLYVGGGTAGNLQLQWCVSTAEAAAGRDHFVLANSALVAYKLV